MRGARPLRGLVEDDAEALADVDMGGGRRRGRRWRCGRRLSTRDCEPAERPREPSAGAGAVGAGAPWALGGARERAPGPQHGPVRRSRQVQPREVLPTGDRLGRGPCATLILAGVRARDWERGRGTATRCPPAPRGASGPPPPAVGRVREAPRLRRRPRRARACACGACVRPRIPRITLVTAAPIPAPTAIAPITISLRNVSASDSEAETEPCSFMRVLT